MKWIVRGFRDYPMYTILFWTVVLPAVLMVLSASQLLGLIDYISKSKFNLKDRFIRVITKPYINHKKG